MFCIVFFLLIQLYYINIDFILLTGFVCLIELLFGITTQWTPLDNSSFAGEYQGLKHQQIMLEPHNHSDILKLSNLGWHQRRS